MIFKKEMSVPRRHLYAIIWVSTLCLSQNLLAFRSKLSLSVSPPPFLWVGGIVAILKALRGFWVYLFGECSMWYSVCYTSLSHLIFFVSFMGNQSPRIIGWYILCPTYLWFLFFLLSTVLILILLTLKYLYSLYVQVLYASVQSHIMLQRSGQWQIAYATVVPYAQNTKKIPNDTFLRGVLGRVI